MPLAGCRVLYTRAAPHWQQAQSTLQALGAQALHIPLLDTRALPFAQSKTPDFSLFTSANAVRHFFAQRASAGQTIAIGGKTAQALAAHGHPPAITAPPPYDSEALLSVWQPQGKQIAIIAAPGGRTHLHDSLRVHNRVEVLHVYERFCPSITLEFSADNCPDAVLIGSSRTLRHLVKIAKPDTLKLLQCRTCIVALSPRIADDAAQLGFYRAISADSACEAAQFAALRRWWTRHSKES